MNTSPDETKEQRELRFKAAEREHDNHHKTVASMLTSIVTYGSEAIKSAALINGGAAGALLAYVGTGRHVVAPEMILAVKILGFGVLTSAIATSLSYLTQYFYQMELLSIKLTWSYPFSAKTGKSQRYRKIAINLHFAAVFTVLIAFTCAASGLYFAASSLEANNISTATRKYPWL